MRQKKTRNEIPEIQDSDQEQGMEISELLQPIWAVLDKEGRVVVNNANYFEAGSYNGTIVTKETAFRIVQE